MRFLCSQHKKQLLKHNEGELIGLWFEWMNQAALYYEVGQWPKAVSYSGCALELAMLYVVKSDEFSKENAAKKLCLSAIYCINCLGQAGYADKAHYVTLQACAFFREQHQQVGALLDLYQWVPVLENQQEHTFFFEKHLNLPIKEQPQSLYH